MCSGGRSTNTAQRRTVGTAAACGVGFCFLFVFDALNEKKTGRARRKKTGDGSVQRYIESGDTTTPTDNTDPTGRHPFRCRLRLPLFEYRGCGTVEIYELAGDGTAKLYTTVLNSWDERPARRDHRVTTVPTNEEKLKEALKKIVNYDFFTTGIYTPSVRTLIDNIACVQTVIARDAAIYQLIVDDAATHRVFLACGNSLGQNARYLDSVPGTEIWNWKEDLAQYVIPEGNEQPSRPR